MTLVSQKSRFNPNPPSWATSEAASAVAVASIANNKKLLIITHKLK